MECDSAMIPVTYGHPIDASRVLLWEVGHTGMVLFVLSIHILPKGVPSLAHIFQRRSDPPRMNGSMSGFTLLLGLLNSICCMVVYWKYIKFPVYLSLDLVNTPSTEYPDSRSIHRTPVYIYSITPPIQTETMKSSIGTPIGPVIPVCGSVDVTLKRSLLSAPCLSAVMELPTPLTCSRVRPEPINLPGLQRTTHVLQFCLQVPEPNNQNLQRVWSTGTKQ